jgi:Ca-activated chloride channel family protein
MLEFVNINNPTIITLVLGLCLLIIFSFIIQIRNISKDKLTKQLAKPGKIGISTRILMKSILLLLIFIFLVISLLRPINGSTPIDILQSNVDIVFIVDTSLSMKVEDMPGGTSRLDGIKSFLTEQVTNQPNFRYAVISTSDKATIEVPPTYDKTEVLNNVELLITKPYLAAKGSSMAFALDALKELYPQGKPTDVILKVLVIGDGEFVGDLKKNSTSIDANLIKLADKFIVFGVGTTAGGKIPKDYGLSGYYEASIDGVYQPVISKLNEAPLTQLASDLKGIYMGPIQSVNKTTLKAELQDQGQYRTTVDEQSTMANSTYNDVYQFAILMFFMLLLIIIFDLYYLI